MGSRKSNSGLFKKGHIPANKGKPLSVTTRKKLSEIQKKKWDKIGRQSKEERLRYNKESQRKRRKDPNFVKEELRKAKEKHAKNPEIRLTQWKNWRVKHRPETLRKQLERKLKVFKYYSKKDSNSNTPCCNCCKEKFTHEFLSIDHIDGRKSMDHKRNFGGKDLYNWVIKNKFPDTVQVLCHNCNLAKGIYGKCPHQK